MELDTSITSYNTGQVKYSASETDQVQCFKNMSIDRNSHIMSDQGEYMQQPPPSMPPPYRAPLSYCSGLHFASDGDQQRPALIPACKLDSLQSSGLHISSNEQDSTTSRLSLSTGNVHFQSVQSPPALTANGLQQCHQLPISSRNVTDFSVSEQGTFQFCNNIASDINSHMSEQGAYMQQPSASVIHPYGTTDFVDLQHFAADGYQQSPINIPGCKMDSLQRFGLPSSPIHHISKKSRLSASDGSRNVQNMGCGPSYQFGKQNGCISDNQHVLSKQHQFIETSGVCLANQEYSVPSNEKHLLQMRKGNYRVPFKDGLPILAPNQGIKPYLNYQQRAAVQNIHNQVAFTGPREPNTNISAQNSPLQLENLAPLFVAQQRQSQLPLQHQHRAQFKHLVQSQELLQKPLGMYYQQPVPPQQSLQRQRPVQHLDLQPSQLSVPWQLQMSARLHCPQQLVTPLRTQQQFQLQQLLQPQQPLPHHQPLQPQKSWQLHQRVQLEESFGDATQNMQSQHVPLLVLNGDCYLNAHQPREITKGSSLLSGKPCNMDDSYNESFQQSDGNASFRGANNTYEFTTGAMESKFQNGQQIYIMISDLGKKCTDSPLRIPAPERQALGSPLGISDNVHKPHIHPVNSTVSLSHSETAAIHKDLSEISKEKGVSHQIASSGVQESGSKCSPHSPSYCTNMLLPSVNDSSVSLSSIGGSYGLIKRSIPLHDPADPQCPEALGSDSLACPQSVWRYSINETNCLDLGPVSNFQSVNKPENVQEISTESTVSSFDQCKKSPLNSSDHWVSYANEISTASELKADRTVNSTPVTSEQPKVNVHTSQANGVEHIQEETNFTKASILKSEPGNQTMPADDLSPGVTILHNSTGKEEVNAVSKLQDCNISASHCQSLKTSNTVPLISNHASVIHPTNRSTEVVSQSINLANSAMIIPPPMSVTNLPAFHLEAIAVMSTEIEGTFPKLSTESDEALDTCLFMVKCSPTTGDSGSKPLLSTTAEQNPCDISSTTTVNRDQTASISIPDQCAGSMEEVFELAAISANAHKSGSTDFTSVKAGEPQIAVVNPMIVSESESICVHQDSDIPKDDLNRKCDYLKENKEKMMLDASPLTNFGAAVPHYLPLPESNLSVGKLEYNSTTGCTESKESFPVPRSFNCGLVKQKKIDLSVQIVEEANNPKAENNKGSLQQNSLAVHQHGPPEYHGLQSVCGAENTWDDSVPVNELHISNICTLVAGSAFYDPQIAKIVDAIPSTKVVASQRREDPQESTNEKDYHFISNKNNRTLCMLRANGQTSVDAQLLETIAIRNDSSFTGEECVETTSLTNQQIPKYGTCKMVTIECGKDTPLNKEYNHEAYLPNSNAKTNEENSVDYCPGTAATTEWVSDYSLREEKNVQDHPCRGNKLSTTDGHSVSFPLLEGVEDRSVHEAQCFNKCLSFMTTQKHKEHSFANNTVSTQDVGHQLSVRSDLVEKGELLLYKSSNFSPLGHLGSENQDLGKGSCANGKAEQSKEKCAKRWSNVMQDSTNISLDNCKNKEQSILGGDLYIFPPVFSDDENEDPINKIQITLIGTDQMHALFPETATHFANQDNAKCSKITSRLEKEPATSDTLPISESSSFPLFRERETNSLFSDDPRLYLHSSLSFANHCSGKQENKNQKQTSLNSNDECSEMNFSTRHYACATNISLREHFRFRSSKENSQPNLPSDNIYRSVSEDKCRNRQHDIAQIVERKNVEGKNSTMIAGQKLIERDRFQLSNEEMSGKMKQCYSKKPRTKSRDKRHKVNASLSDDCKSVFVFKDSKSSTDTTYQTIPIIKLNCPDTHKGFLTEGVFEQLGNQAAVDNKRQTTEHLVVKIDLLNLLKTPDGAQNMKSTEVNCCITKANAIKMHNKRSTNGIEHSKKYMLRSMSKCLHSKTENTSKSCTTGTKVSVLEEPPEKQEVQKEKSFAAKVACSSEVLVSNSTQFQDSSVAKTTNSKSGKARFAQYRKRIVTIQEYRQHQKTQQEKSEKKTLGDELKQNKPVHKKKLHPRLKRKSSAQSHQACLAENMFKCLKSPEVIKTSVETHEQKEAYPGKYTHCVLLNNDHGSKSKMDLQDTCVKLAKDLISSDKVAADWQKTSFSAKAPKNSKKPYSSRFAFKTTTNENVFTTKWMVGTSPSKTSNDKNYKLDLNAKTPRPSSDAWKFRLREREPCRKVLQSCYLVGTQYSVGTLQLCSSVADRSSLPDAEVSSRGHL